MSTVSHRIEHDPIGTELAIFVFMLSEKPCERTKICRVPALLFASTIDRNVVANGIA
jgi:hypothetical protein